MPLTNTQIDDLSTRAAGLKTNRGNWESHWQEIAEVLYPNAASFITERTPGEKLMRNVYDSTGIIANQLLAAGVFSMATSPVQQWFQLATGSTKLDRTYAVRLWLEEAAKIMYDQINMPAARFNTALHECYLDHGSFGNMTMFVTENDKLSNLLFQSLPLNECYYVENSDGVVDTLFRKYRRTVKHLIGKFGVESCSSEVQKLYAEGEMDEKVDCMHIIMPRGDAHGVFGMNMPFVSAYIDLEHTHLMEEGGYRELPFMAARFYKSPNEVYGRGPGCHALPDVKMLMEVMKTTLRAAHKQVDPPLALPDQTFLQPIRSVAGGLNFYRASLGGPHLVQQIPTGKPEIGYEMVQELRNRIRETFFVDQLQLQQGPQMTATEVLQRTEEKLRMMGPLLGRLQSEFLGPCVGRSFGLLYRSGKIPPIPRELMNAPLRIVYTSPIARAQEQVQANGLMRATQVMQPFIDMKPEILDAYDTDTIAADVNEMFGVSPRYILPPDKVKAVRDRRRKMQEMEIQAKALQSGGQGIESLARAGNENETLGGLMDPSMETIGEA